MFTQGIIIKGTVGWKELYEAEKRQQNRLLLNLTAGNLQLIFLLVLISSPNIFCRHESDQSVCVGYSLFFVFALHFLSHHRHRIELSKNNAIQWFWSNTTVFYHFYFEVHHQYINERIYIWKNLRLQSTF